MNNIILFNQPWLLVIYIIAVLLLIFAITKGQTYTVPFISLGLITLVTVFEFIFGATIQEILILLLFVAICIFLIILRRLKKA